MADASQKKLLNIFGEARLNVPSYQRSYSWNEKQVRDLLEDIEYVIDRGANGRDVVHYFGTIVLDDIEKIDSPAPSDWTLYDIVDGQQRLTSISLLVGCICEELDRLDGVVDVNTSRRSEPQQHAQEHRNIYIKYQNKDNGQRLEPADLTKRAYNKLVVSQEDPADLLAEDPVLPARKLARAKQYMNRWIRSIRSDFLEGELEDAAQTDLSEYYTYLENVLSVVGNTFKVTQYEVDEAAEAGRLFQIVNDRGKDLTIADKVRSHLLYCAGEVDELDIREIARNFNEAIEKITLHGGDEDRVDQFVNRHWEMFTGEASQNRVQDNIGELHRRIKQIDRYAPLDREPEEDLVNWVETYVKTILDAADAFVAIYDPAVLKEKHPDIDSEVINRLYSIQNAGAATNFRPLLMASYLKNGPKSDEFKRIVSQCEVFSFRSYQILSRSTRLLRRQLKQESHRLYMADYSETEIMDIFGARTIDTYYNSIGNAVDVICENIDEAIGSRASENEFRSYLTKADVIAGSETTGWTGFERKDTVKYLFYEYERHLREQEGDTGLHTLVEYSEFQDDCEVEHIAPRNPNGEEAKLERHDENVERLANLAFLWPDDNKDVSNDAYEDKYNNTYRNSGVKVLEELPTPPAEWNLDALDEREDRLVEFCLDRWSGETVAHVWVDGELREETKFHIREKVDSHYKHSGMGRVPTIKIKNGSPFSENEDRIENLRTCEDCHSVKIGNVEGDDEDEFYCVCGAALEGPSYQIEQ